MQFETNFHEFLTELVFAIFSRNFFYCNCTPSTQISLMSYTMYWMPNLKKLPAAVDHHQIWRLFDACVNACVPRLTTQTEKWNQFNWSISLFVHHFIECKWKFPRKYQIRLKFVIYIDGLSVIEFSTKSYIFACSYVTLVLRVSLPNRVEVWGENSFAHHRHHFDELPNAAGKKQISVMCYVLVVFSEQWAHSLEPISMCTFIFVYAIDAVEILKPIETGTDWKMLNWKQKHWNTFSTREKFARKRNCRQRISAICVRDEERVTNMKNDRNLFKIADVMHFAAFIYQITYIWDTFLPISLVRSFFSSFFSSLLHSAIWTVFLWATFFLYSSNSCYRYAPKCTFPFNALHPFMCRSAAAAAVSVVNGSPLLLLSLPFIRPKICSWFWKRFMGWSVASLHLRCACVFSEANMCKRRIRVYCIRFEYHGENAEQGERKKNDEAREQRVNKTHWTRFMSWMDSKKVHVEKPGMCAFPHLGWILKRKRYTQHRRRSGKNAKLNKKSLWMVNVCADFFSYFRLVHLVC